MATAPSVFCSCALTVGTWKIEEERERHSTGMAATFARSRRLDSIGEQQWDWGAIRECQLFLLHLDADLHRTQTTSKPLRVGSKNSIRPLFRLKCPKECSFSHIHPFGGGGGAWSRHSREIFPPSATVLVACLNLKYHFENDRTYIQHFQWIIWNAETDVFISLFHIVFVIK